VVINAANGVTVLGHGSNVGTLVIAGTLSYDTSLLPLTADDFAVTIGAGTITAGALDANATFKDGVFTLPAAGTFAGPVTVTAYTAVQDTTPVPAGSIIVNASYTAGVYTGSKTGLELDAASLELASSTNNTITVSGLLALTWKASRSGTYSIGGAGATAAVWTNTVAATLLKPTGIEGKALTDFGVLTGTSSAGDPTINIAGAFVAKAVLLDLATKGVITLGNSASLKLAGGAAGGANDAAAIFLQASTTGGALHSGPASGVTAAAALLNDTLANLKNAIGGGSSSAGVDADILGNNQHADWTKIDKTTTFIDGTAAETATKVNLNA
jgi:hypothetical protein